VEQGTNSMFPAGDCEMSLAAGFFDASWSPVATRKLRGVTLRPGADFLLFSS